jgi:hypothetical protein
MLTPEVLTERARQSLREGRFRQAREDFKALLKMGRMEHGSDLLAANLGLFRQMLSKGQGSEAQTVLENIRQMAPPAEALAAEVQWLHAQGNYLGAAEQVAGVLSPEQPLPLSREKLADVLVLGFAPLPVLKNRMPELHAELECIHGALEALSRESYAAATEALRPIGYRSLFAEWKICIKGLAAFHTGDDATARKAFAMLRADSVCREACEGYSTLLEGSLLDSGEEDEVKAKRAEGAARILGLEELYPLLARVDYLWSRGRFRDALSHVMEVRPGLLLKETGPEGWLARFLAQGPPTSDPDRLMEYFSFWSTKAKSLAEIHLPSLSGTLAMEKHLPLYGMRESWEALIAKHPMAKSPKAKARIRLHMGTLALGCFSGGRGKGTYRDAERDRGLHPADLSRARRDIEASLRLEEGNLAAWQALARALELSGMKSVLNRHLGRMAARFPDDGATQEKLALDCASRSAFGKAIKYLDNARALNPLDRGLVRLETLIRIDQGLGCFLRPKPGKPGALEQGRRAFRDALASAEINKGSASVFGGRNWVLLLWYLAECWVGEDIAARELRGKWDESAPLPLYFAASHFAQEWRLRPQQEEFQDLFSQALNRPSTPEDVDYLIRFWKEWQASPKSPYAEGSRRNRWDQTQGLFEKAFAQNTPPSAYLPLLRHMYDTLGSFTVSRLCARLLKWHAEDFPLRCLQALSRIAPETGLLRNLKKEALEKGEKEWASKLETRMNETSRIPEAFGGRGGGLPEGFLEIFQNLIEDEEAEEDEDAEEIEDPLEGWGTRNRRRGQGARRDAKKVGGKSGTGSSQEEELPF